MLERYESIVIEIVSGAIIPFMQVFALYVITHGHYGPGGGFQGGAILAASIILLRLYLGWERSYQKFPPKWAAVLGAMGMLVYGLAGLIPMATGGMFLDYAYLPVPGEAAALRYLGILIVEAGIALAVFGTMVTIFDNLTRGQ